MSNPEQSSQQQPPSAATARTTTAGAGAPAVSGEGRAATQLKASLRGCDFATQVQMLAPENPGSARDASVHAAAARGIGGSGGKLPYGEQIQRSFGGYDLSNVQVHADASAMAATAAMGADAYASGNHVVLGAGGKDLHTVAHEAAHVVQQRSGVSLSGGIGQAGDPYERHADAVADLVVQGQSAEGLLGAMAGGRSGSGHDRNVQQQALDPSIENDAIAEPSLVKTEPACAPSDDASLCVSVENHVLSLETRSRFLLTRMDEFETLVKVHADQTTNLAAARKATRAEGTVTRGESGFTDVLATAETLLTIFGGFAAAASIASRAVKELNDLVKDVGDRATVLKGVSASGKLAPGGSGKQLHGASEAVQKELEIIKTAILSLGEAQVRNVGNTISEYLGGCAVDSNSISNLLVVFRDAANFPKNLGPRLNACASIHEEVFRRIRAAQTLVSAVARTGENSEHLRPGTQDRGFLDAVVTAARTDGNAHGLTLMTVSKPSAIYDPYTGNVSSGPTRSKNMLACSTQRAQDLARFHLNLRFGAEEIHIPLFGIAFEVETTQLAIVQTGVETGVIPTRRYERIDMIDVHGFGGIDEVPVDIWYSPDRRDAWLNRRHQHTGLRRSNEVSDRAGTR